MNSNIAAACYAACCTIRKKLVTLFFTISLGGHEKEMSSENDLIAICCKVIISNYPITVSPGKFNYTHKQASCTWCKTK